MYKITDNQVEFIYNDISARGVKNNSLLDDLVDHVCCIIEKELKETDDFEYFYSNTIKQFYETDLKEIEEETRQLLIFKHYYFMKKMLLYSGAFTTVVSVTGILLKIFHAPGAGACLVLGLSSFSLIFLPLLFVLKSKEENKSKNKILLGVSFLCGIMLSLSVLFKMQSWPGANIMGILSLLIMLAIYVPIYFVHGVKNPQTKINTITTSVILVLCCMLFLSLINFRPHIQDKSRAVANNNIQATYKNITDLCNKKLNTITSDSLIKITTHYNDVCNKIEQLKLDLINETTGSAITKIDFVELGKLEEVSFVSALLFNENGEVKAQLSEIIQTINKNKLIDLEDNWAKQNLFVTPLINVLQNLTQLQINLRSFELTQL